jgi:hypothetical protein
MTGSPCLQVDLFNANVEFVIAERGYVEFVITKHGYRSTIFL